MKFYLQKKGEGCRKRFKHTEGGSTKGIEAVLTQELEVLAVVMRG